MSKKFDNWNDVKKNLHGEHKAIIFKERDIFWVSIGVNIGYEQDGKGEIFSRPVVVVKKYNNNLFLEFRFQRQLEKVVSFLALILTMK